MNNGGSKPRATLAKSITCITSRVALPQNLTATDLPNRGSLFQSPRMKTEVAVCRLLFLFLTSAVVRTQGADLYVSTLGDNLNLGTLAQPLQTITRAYSLAVPGVTI